MQVLPIQASQHQKDNPILMHVKSAQWEIVKHAQEADFIVGQERHQIRFLALSNFIRYRTYIEQHKIPKGFLLLLVDCDNADALREINVSAFVHEMRLLAGFSFEDCGRLLETLHVYNAKKAEDVVQGLKGKADYEIKVREALTVIKGVNSTDVVNLLAKFKSLRGIANATEAELREVPFIGDKKAKNLFKCFNDSFPR